MEDESNKRVKLEHVSILDVDFGSSSDDDGSVAFGEGADSTTTDNSDSSDGGEDDYRIDDYAPVTQSGDEAAAAAGNDRDDDYYSLEECEALRESAKSMGAARFIQSHLNSPTPVNVRKLLRVFGFSLAPASMPDPEYPVSSTTQEDKKAEERSLWLLLASLVKKFCHFRPKLSAHNSIDDAVSLISRARRILILTGAGISVSCGIPDFRSDENGLYSIISHKYPDLDDPQLMFDIRYFSHDHRPFFDLARSIFPSNFEPSPTHRFIRHVEKEGRLLRNYTQNIDTLEKKAGIERVVFCHGSFDTATCLRCKRTVDGDDIREFVLRGEAPFCTVCTAAPASSDLPVSGEDADDILPIMKPDIVFFGENLPAEFDRKIEEDRMDADLMIVIGSSLKVAPVSDLVGHIPHDVPLILINREPVYHYHRSFDIQLLGYCDDIVRELSSRLGWDIGISSEGAGGDLEPVVTVEPSHIHLFKGHKFSHERHRRIFGLEEEVDSGDEKIVANEQVGTESPVKKLN